MASEERRTTGHMMRSADGRLYFIPDEQLEQFRVPEEQHQRAQQIVEQGDPHFTFSESRLEPIAHMETPPPESANFCVARITE